MKRSLIIVQCGGRKIWRTRPHAGPTRAKDAYVSGYFQNNRAYAERFGKRWLILSAKYGFLDPEVRIRNYNVSFLDPRTKPIGIGTLRTQVKRKRLGQHRDVVVLGGSVYAAIVHKTFEGASVRIRQPFRGLRLCSLLSERPLVGKNRASCGTRLNGLGDTSWDASDDSTFECLRQSLPHIAKAIEAFAREPRQVR